MSNQELCDGSPCVLAEYLVEAEQVLTQQLARVSEAGFQALDTYAKLSDTDDAIRSRVETNIEDVIRAYDAIDESREETRQQIAQYCAQCTGMLNGICSAFSREQEG
jgi:phosphate uptake regulator